MIKSLFSCQPSFFSNIKNARQSDWRAFFMLEVKAD